MSTLLEVNDLSISFAGIKAVQHFSFKLEQGEVLGLIGPNGSGKSTTVNLISGAYTPNSGDMIFDGHHLNPKQTMAQRCHLGIGRTFQTPKPFGNMTVYDNVFTVFLQKYSFKEAAVRTRKVLEMSQLDALGGMMSSKLSIEKRKWMDLARVLATEPKLIMMDEVMAGLNPNEMEGSLDFIRQINNQGIAILFIEHVMKAVVSVCHRAIVLNGGRFLAEGTPEEVLSNPSVIEAYIGGGKKDAAKH